MNMVVRSSRPWAARAVLCGSYRRDIDGLRRAYDELAVTGCQVLSPRRVDFMDGEFVVDAAEVGLSPREIENWYLRAIEQSDFILLHAPPRLCWHKCRDGDRLCSRIKETNLFTNSTS